jgi:hypothetical protein
MERVAAHVYSTTEQDQISNLLLGLDKDSHAKYLLELSSDPDYTSLFSMVFPVDKKKFELTLILIIILPHLSGEERKTKAFIINNFVNNEIDFKEYVSEIVDMKCGHPGCKDDIFSGVFKKVSELFLMFQQQQIISGWLYSSISEGKYAIKFVDDDPKLRARIKGAVKMAAAEL